MQIPNKYICKYQSIISDKHVFATRCFHPEGQGQWNLCYPVMATIYEITSSAINAKRSLLKGRDFIDMDIHKHIGHLGPRNKIKENQHDHLCVGRKLDDFYFLMRFMRIMPISKYRCMAIPSLELQTSTLS